VHVRLYDLAALLLAQFMKVKFTVVEAGLKKFLFLMGLGEAIAYLAISWVIAGRLLPLSWR